MKQTYVTLILAISVLCVSCNKDDDDSPNNQCKNPESGDPGDNDDPEGNSFSIPTNEGTYWVYQWYSVDFEGNETEMPQRDSLYMVADTNINGQVYFHRKGNSSFYSLPSFFRDSAGVFIDNNSKALYSYTNFSDTLETGSYGSEWEWHLQMEPPQLVSSSLGMLEVLEARTHLYRPNGEPANECGDSEIILSTYHADEIGTIMMQTGYSTPLQACDYYLEARLTDFYVAPE